MTPSNNTATNKLENISVVKACQECHVIYPARWALTSERFDVILKNDKELSMPEENDDYELRRLRDGYIYIITINVGDENNATFTKDAHQLYLYRYSSPEFSDGEESIPYSFQQYFYYDGLKSPPSIMKIPQRMALPKQHIELPLSVNIIDIMYSDMLLSPELITDLLDDKNNARSVWMHKVNLKAKSYGVYPLEKLKTYVKDFSDNAKELTKEKSNAYRFTPIGKATRPIHLHSETGKGFIVALEDPIGTSRDLAHLHYYLTQLRQEKLRKYEYALSTAGFIHSEVLKEYWKEYHWAESSDNITNYYPYPSLASLYERLDIDSAHLSPNSHSDIFNVIANDLELDMKDIKGVNAVHKMARIPNLYGIPFKNIARVMARHIHDSLQARLFALRNILTQPTVLLHGPKLSQIAAANWCWFMHGAFFGLDFSPYGRNAITTTLDSIDTSFKFPPEEQEDKGLTDLLKNSLANISSVLGVLESLSEAEDFDLASYDLFVDLIVEKSYIKDFRKQKGEIKLHEKIRRVYRVNPNIQSITLVDNGKNNANKPKVPRNMKKISERFKFQYSDKSFPNIEHSHYSDTELFTAGKTYSGFAKLLAFTPIFDYFSENDKKTAEGRLANDPTLALAIALFDNLNISKTSLERYAAQFEKRIKVAVKKQPAKEAININSVSLSEKIDSRFMRFKHTLMSAGTLLTGLNALVSYGNWKEAEYKGDNYAAYGALLNGTGGSLTYISSEALGILAGKQTALISRLMLFARFNLYLGIAMIALGIVFSLLEREDIEIWIENGFWGNSPNYWGEPVGLYQWETKERLKDKDFKYQFDKSMTKDVLNYFQIEMQRYFQFKEEIILSKQTGSSIIVQHPNIINNEIAQTIRVRELYINGIFNYDRQPDKIEYIELGKAILYFNMPWRDLYVHNTEDPEPRYFTLMEDEVHTIGITVSMSDYQGSKSTFSSKFQEIDMR